MSSIEQSPMREWEQYTKMPEKAVLDPERLVAGLFFSPLSEKMILSLQKQHSDVFNLPEDAIRATLQSQAPLRYIVSQLASGECRLTELSIAQNTLFLSPESTGKFLLVGMAKSGKNMVEYVSEVFGVQISENTPVLSEQGVKISLRIAVIELYKKFSATTLIQKSKEATNTIKVSLEESGNETTSA